MPELPEVEFARGLLASVALGRCVARVRWAEDTIVYEDCSGAQVQDALEGGVVSEVQRRGKHLWLQCSGRPAVLLHFGMTGRLVLPGQPGIELAATPDAHGSQWPPRFWKLWLEFDDGGQIVMTNTRRLGRIRLRQSVLTEPPIVDLGFDPLLDPPEARVFCTHLRRRSAALKGLLLNQMFVAGVGNWLADEILYDARIAPHRAASSLTQAEGERLLASLCGVIGRAVQCDAQAERFPVHWLFHRRWRGGQGRCDGEGNPLQVDTLSGRTTVWVPAVQR